jgi:hypothetical protein
MRQSCGSNYLEKKQVSLSPLFGKEPHPAVNVPILITVGILSASSSGPAKSAQSVTIADRSPDD